MSLWKAVLSNHLLELKALLSWSLFGVQEVNYRLVRKKRYVWPLRSYFPCGEKMKAIPRTRVWLFLFLSIYQIAKSGTTLTPPIAMVINPAPITKRVKKSKQPLHITKDLGRWKPTDDLLLINAVLQVRSGKTYNLLVILINHSILLLKVKSLYYVRCIFLQTTDLTCVHLGVKFSSRFTLRDIKERWYALLYDPVISK